MPFAILFAGAPRELAPGQPFQTDRQVVLSHEEAALSGLAIGWTWVGRITDHSDDALETYDPARRARFLIQDFIVPEAPAGQAVISYTLAIIAGAIVAQPTFGPAFVPVPMIVSMMQAQLALNAAGLLASVEAAVNSSSELTKIYWKTASNLHRDHPLVISLTAALGLTPAQVDDLFRAAILLF